MPSFNVIIQPEAEADLDEAYQYFEQQKSRLGFQLLEDLTEVLELLENNPLLFQKVYGEKRRAVIRRFGYNVIYKVVDADVYVLAIMDGSRDPRKWKGRK
ncbi:MAG: type II toxin-antitoxin system RelE/ParE family toxin [Saprospiraceae bacterium]